MTHIPATLNPLTEAYRHNFFYLGRGIQGPWDVWRLETGSDGYDHCTLKSQCLELLAEIMPSAPVIIHTPRVEPTGLP